MGRRKKVGIGALIGGATIPSITIYILLTQVIESCARLIPK